MYVGVLESGLAVKEVFVMGDNGNGLCKKKCRVLVGKGGYYLTKVVLNEV